MSPWAGEAEHIPTAAVVAAVVAWTVVGHSHDAQSCWGYSCEIGQLKRSADVLDVERVERKGSETEKVDVEVVSEPFVAKSVAAAER